MISRIALALVRPPGANFAQGLTQASLGAPDLDRALAQHGAYVRALERAGVRTIRLDPDPEHPDATFVEDCAVIVGRDAILTRPGAPSRRGEVASIGEALRPWVRTVETIGEPGTLDGGDVLDAEGRWLIGISERTDENGSARLTERLAARGCPVEVVDIRGMPGLLHLKTGISWVGEGTAVVVPALEGAARSIGLEPLVVEEPERYGANGIVVNGRVLVPSGSPSLVGRLRKLGRQVEVLETSEFRKMDGGLSCLSLRLPAG